jgi:hypothetical protein
LALVRLESMGRVPSIYLRALIARIGGKALALTLLTIRYAHQHNATRREIFNDSRNTPIFNMPAQVSYYRIPGSCIMQQTLG